MKKHQRNIMQAVAMEEIGVGNIVVIQVDDSSNIITVRNATTKDVKVQK